MKKTYRHILARALAAVPLACAALLSSCYTDEYDGCPTDGQQPVAVRLNISAGEPGDLNATRAEGDEIEGEQHEFMHTLYIYIVDRSGRLVKKFENPLEGSALASTGDVKSWQTRKFTLEPGTYTVFAFANIDDYQGWVYDEDTQLSGYEFIHDEFKEEGGLRVTFYDFRLVDPASSEGDFFIETVNKAGDDMYVRIHNSVPVLVDNLDLAATFNIEQTDEAATSNDEISTSEVKVIAGAGQITINGAAGKKVVVSNILGQVVANTVITSDNATIAAPQGIVVVAVEGEEAVKAIVK